MSERKPRIGKSGKSPLQALKDLPEDVQEKIATRAREISSQKLIEEIRAGHGIRGLSEQRLSDFWRWLGGRRALRQMQEDARQFREAFSQEGVAASPEEIHIRTVDYLRLKGVRENDERTLRFAVSEARKAIELERDARKLAILESNAERAKAALEGVKSRGGLSAQTLQAIEEAAKLL